MKAAYFYCILIVFFGSPVYAGDSEGTVNLLLPITANADGVVFLSTSPSTHTNKPACSTVGNEWALSLAGGSGKAVYAMLLSAQAQGLKIHVYGAGNCNVWGDRESIAGASYVY